MQIIFYSYMAHQVYQLPLSLPLPHVTYVYPLYLVFSTGYLFCVIAVSCIVLFAVHQLK